MNEMSVHSFKEGPAPAMRAVHLAGLLSNRRSQVPPRGELVPRVGGVGSKRAKHPSSYFIMGEGGGVKPPPDHIYVISNPSQFQLFVRVYFIPTNSSILLGGGFAASFHRHPLVVFFPGGVTNPSPIF